MRREYDERNGWARLNYPQSSTVNRTRVFNGCLIGACIAYLRLLILRCSLTWSQKHFMSRSVHSIPTSSCYSTHHVLWRLTTTLLAVQSHVIHWLTSRRRPATRHRHRLMFRVTWCVFDCGLSRNGRNLKSARSIALHPTLWRRFPVILSYAVNCHGYHRTTAIQFRDLWRYWSDCRLATAR